MDKRQLGGIGLLIGNLALMLNGLAAQKSSDYKVRDAGKERMIAGIAWSGGALLLARYGTQPVDRQTNRLRHKLTAYLQRENVPLDAATLRAATEEQRRHWFSKLEDFLYNYPVECDNAYNIVASTAMIRSGLLRKQSITESKTGQMNVIFGSLGLIGSLISIFVPERTPEQIANSGQAGTFLGKMQERPLVYALGFSLVSTAAEALTAYNEYNTAKGIAKDDPFHPYASAMWILSAIATALYIVGDWLTDTGEKRATGSKEDREAAQQTIIAEAAHILEHLPKTERRKTVHKLAEYMAEQPELRMVDFNASKLADKLLEKIEEHQKANPVTAIAASPHAEKLKREAIASAPLRV